jgi:hypothetical protein
VLREYECPDGVSSSDRAEERPEGEFNDMGGTGNRSNPHRRRVEEVVQYGLNGDPFQPILHGSRGDRAIEAER